MFDIAGLPTSRRFCAWRTETIRGRRTKIPYGGTDGDGGQPRKASSIDDSTWLTLEGAMTLVAFLRAQWDLGLSSGRDGLERFEGGPGVMLGRLEDESESEFGSVLCGIDLDSCVGAEGLTDWAIAAMEAAPGYWEISPSGTGLKLLGLVAKEDESGVRAALGLAGGKDGLAWKRAKRSGGSEAGRSESDHAAGIEIYLGRRFFALTGNALGARSIEGFGIGTAQKIRAIGEGLKGKGPAPILMADQDATPALPDLTRFGGASGEMLPGWDALSTRISGLGASGASGASGVSGRSEFENRLSRLWAGDLNGLGADRSRSAIAFRLGAEMRANGFSEEETVLGLAGHPLTSEWMAEKGLVSGGREIGRLLEKAAAGLVSFGPLPIVEGLSSGDPRPRRPVGRPRVGVGGGASAASHHVRSEAEQRGSGGRGATGGTGAADEISTPTLDAAAVEELSAGADWRRWLQRAGKAILPNLYNGRLALTWAPEWRGVFGLNEFAEKVMILRRPPYLPETPNSGEERWAGGRGIRDSDRLPTCGWLQSQGIQIGPRAIGDIILSVALNNRYNPVREYLDHVEKTWDGSRRLDTWLTRHMGAEDTIYVRSVASMSLIGAVARVYKPGCKVDTMPVLEGNQGILKSSSLRALFGEDYFLDNIADLTSKDAKIQLMGKWGVEIAEMDKFTKAEISHVKVFLSTQVDNFRKPYGVFSEDVPRTCVIFGTINPGEEGYLTDETGNRRIWPIRCSDRQIDLTAIKAERDQLWAEAVVRWRAGERWWMDAQTAFQQEQAAEQRLQRDSWHDRIAAYLIKRSETTVTELLHSAIVKPVGQWNRSDQMRIVRILKMQNWVRRQFRIPDSDEREWKYVRKNGIVVPFPVAKKEETSD